MRRVPKTEQAPQEIKSLGQCTSSMQCKINTSNNKSDKESQFIILSAEEISKQETS